MPLIIIKKKYNLRALITMTLNIIVDTINVLLYDLILVEIRSLTVCKLLQ